MRLSRRSRRRASTWFASLGICDCFRRGFVQQFPRKILNIHPSLLPAFPGLEAQEQAFVYGVKVSGCTVHFVDEELDHGAIIVQKTVPVLDETTSMLWRRGFWSRSILRIARRSRLCWAGGLRFQATGFK